MHEHVRVCANNMSWERSFVPVQATPGEAGLDKGMEVLNESQVNAACTATVLCRKANIFHRIQ